MGTFDALDKVKKAAERASQTAKDAKDQAAVRASEIRDLTVSKAQEASALAADARGQAGATLGGWKQALSEKVATFKEAALENVREVVSDLNSYLPALAEAGYTLCELAVEVGISPKVVATFAARPDITEEKVDAVIAAHQDVKIVAVILRALYGAYKLQNSINIAGMKPHGIDLTIGLELSVAVKFA